MGMPIITIDREPTVPTDGGEKVAAGGTRNTDADSTPTYLSTESLTFTGATTVGIAAVAVYGQVAGAEASPTVILWVAGILGVILIALGLAARTNKRGEWYNWLGQVVLGLFNTVLLAAALLGVYRGT